MQYKQQDNPLLSVKNYTPLVISGNDKKKQETLLSQSNTRINREKYTFYVIKSLEHAPNSSYMSSRAKSILWDSPFKFKNQGIS